LDAFRVIGSPKGGDPHGDPVLRRGEAKHGDVHRIDIIVQTSRDAIEGPEFFPAAVAEPA